MLTFLAGVVLGGVLVMLPRLVIGRRGEDAVPLSTERRQMFVAHERQGG